MFNQFTILMTTLLVSTYSMPADYFRFSMTIGDGSPVTLQPIYFNMTSEGDLFLVAFGSTVIASKGNDATIDEPVELDDDINAEVEDLNGDRFFAQVDEDKQVYGSVLPEGVISEIEAQPGLENLRPIDDTFDDDTYNEDVIDNVLRPDESEEQWHIDTNNV